MTSYKPRYADWWIVEERKRCRRIVDACNREITHCLVDSQRWTALAERRDAALERWMQLWAMSTLPPRDRSWPAAIAELRELRAQERDMALSAEERVRIGEASA